LEGNSHEYEEDFNIPSAEEEGEVDVGLRKAVALTQYVDALTEYVTADKTVANENQQGEMDDDYEEDDYDEDDEDDEEAGKDVVIDIKKEAGESKDFEIDGWTWDRLLKLHMDDIKTTTATTTTTTTATATTTTTTTTSSNTSGVSSNIPSHWTSSMRQHLASALNFHHLQSFLSAEMAACQDTSIEAGKNRNILDTIQQIFQIECKEFESDTTNLVKSMNESKRKQKFEALLSKQMEHPRGMTCPITLILMKDPVIAADGHSYERSAIEKWFQEGKNLSPITGERMNSRSLIANHALRAAIDDYVNSKVDHISV
jgi:hypothetical protein